MTVPSLQIKMWNVRVYTAIEQGRNSADNNGIQEYDSLTNEITDRNKCIGLELRKSILLELQKFRKNNSYISNLSQKA